jgi:hypothetical protein
MQARGWIIGVAVFGAGLVSTAAAEPAPRPVDVKAMKAQGVVLQDAQGGVYVVFRGDDAKVFYGPNSKAVYEQVIVGSSSDGEGRWEFNTWAPRKPGNGLGTLEHKKDGSFHKSCGDKDDTGLTELTGEKAHAVLDKTPFLSMGIVRVPHLLARDDSGVYYYVDRIAKVYGGKGYRVFVGRKGALKQLPLVDVASDSAGEVFSTKSGDLRLVRNNQDDKEKMTWVKGGRRTDLVFLDTEVNSVVIFKDLGLYGFLGTLCDDV